MKLRDWRRRDWEGRNADPIFGDGGEARGIEDRNRVSVDMEKVQNRDLGKDLTTYEHAG